MTATVAQIWRHPIKSHGAERLARTDILAGQPLPWDRFWAVAHDSAAAETGDGQWAPCSNFTRGAQVTALMAMTAELAKDKRQVTLSHPDLGTMTVDPDTEGGRIIAWTSPLTPENRAKPAKVVRAGARGMTDSDWPSVAILSLSSLDTLGQSLGRSLDPRRFRGNIWLDGLAPWDEFGWIGRRLRIGSAEFLVREPITRCRATTANPETGKTDADTLSALERGWGHRDFGVYAQALSSGHVAEGDEVALLP